MELEVDTEGLTTEQDSPLSSGTTEHTQPAVVLVISPSVSPAKLKQFTTLLSTLSISSFVEKSSDRSFLCLYLTKSKCEDLAKRFSYHVRFMVRKGKNDSNSWLTRLVSLVQYGSMSYESFTRVNYTVKYLKKLKTKLKPEELSSLYSVRVQSELIYTVLKRERIFEIESFKIEAHFVPHTPEAAELEKKISWFPPHFPLREFRDYFGEELAFVYAWSNYWWLFGLLPIALASLITFIYGLATETDPPHVLDEKSHFWLVFTRVMLNPSTEYYIVFLVIWISVFQYQWSRAAPVFSLQWGVANFNKEEEYNIPQIKLRKFLRLPNLIISMGGFLIAAASTFILFLVTEIVIRIQLNKLDFGTLDDVPHADKYTKTTIISFICSLFYTILNTLAGTFLIPWLSNFLTSLEDHKFQSYFNNSLLLKDTGYYFMSSYGYLLYLVLGVNVIISQHFDVDVDALEECTYGVCMITISQQVVIQILVLRLKDIVISLSKSLKGKLQRKKEYKVTSHDLQYIIENYNSVKFVGPSECRMWMRDRVLMYGYLTLFSYHLPLLALLALLLETLVTYYELKMLLRSQRPQPRRVCNIKQWEGIIYLVNIMSIVINFYSMNHRIDQYHRSNSSDLLQLDKIPFYLMPLFIFLSSLIHIQDAVSGDKIQSHLHNQHRRAINLLSDTSVDVDGLATASTKV